MNDVSRGFPEFSSVEVRDLKKDNQQAIARLTQETRALVNRRLARNITKEEFDAECALIHHELRAHRERARDLDDEYLLRAYEIPGVRQRLFPIPA
jgi:hypothetical protein